MRVRPWKLKAVGRKMVTLPKSMNPDGLMVKDWTWNTTLRSIFSFFSKEGIKCLQSFDYCLRYFSEGAITDF